MIVCPSTCIDVRNAEWIFMKFGIEGIVLKFVHISILRTDNNNKYFTWRTTSTWTSVCISEVYDFKLSRWPYRMMSSWAIGHVNIDLVSNVLENASVYITRWCDESQGWTNLYPQSIMLSAVPASTSEGKVGEVSSQSTLLVISPLLWCFYSSPLFNHTRVQLPWMV
jgi:hypothetical protein